MIYKFNFNGKEYELGESNLEAFINDEEFELNGIDENIVLQLLSKGNEVEFQNAYYEVCCQECRCGKEEKKKVYDFLEYYFYVYGKDGEFVTSSIDDDYQGKSFMKLYREGIVDSSYIVTVIVCKNCGNYSIEIEEFEL